MLDRIQENSAFIENRRKLVTFSVTDLEAIRNWEIETKQASPPFDAYYKELVKSCATLFA